MSKLSRKPQGIVALMTLKMLIMISALYMAGVQGTDSCSCNVGLLWDGVLSTSTLILTYTMQANQGSHQLATDAYLSTYYSGQCEYSDYPNNPTHHQIGFQANQFEYNIMSVDTQTGYITIDTSYTGYSRVYLYAVIQSNGGYCSYNRYLYLRVYVEDCSNEQFYDYNSQTFDQEVLGSATTSKSFSMITSSSTYCKYLLYDFENIPATDDTIYRNSISYGRTFGIRPRETGQFQFRIKGYMWTGSTANTTLKTLVWTSEVKTLNVSCGSSSEPNVTVLLNETTVGSATAAFTVEVVPIADSCQVTSVQVDAISCSTGLSNLDTITLISGNIYQITVDLSKRGWYTYKINTTVSGSTDQISHYDQTVGYNNFTVWCDPNTNTISDGFSSLNTTNLTLHVGDTVNDYWEFDNFTATNADCGADHSSYVIVNSSDTSTILTGLTLGLNSNGTNRVTVDDMSLKNNYSFKIRALQTDGNETQGTQYFYSQEFTIIVECGPNSTNIIDQAPHEYMFEVGIEGLDTFTINKYVSPTECAILSQTFVQDVDNQTFPVGLVDPPVLDNNVYTFTVANISQQGSYKFKIQVVSEGGFIFNSSEKAVFVTCVATSAVITDNITTVQDYHVSDAVDTYMFYKFISNVDCSPYKYEVLNATDQEPEGLISNVAEEVPGRPDWYYVKISNMLIEQRIEFKIKGLIYGNGTHFTDQVNLTVTCGQYSGEVDQSMVTNHILHISVNDTLQVPALTKQLQSCPITNQEIVALTPNGTAYEYPTGFALNSTWNPRTNNLTVVVDDNSVKGTYNFSIMATMKGGIFYSNYSTVRVICGPKSVNITGDPSLQMLSKFQNDVQPYRFPSFVTTNPECPVNKTYLVTKTGSFPQGIAKSSPIYNEALQMFEVYLADTSLVGNYFFYIETLLEGNSTYRTKQEKKIQVLEIPKEDNPLNMAPAFQTELVDQSIKVKEGDEYTGDNQYLYVYSPQALDVEENVVSIELLDSGGLKQVEFEVDSSNDTFFLKIDLAALSENDAGDYVLKIRLKDDKSALQNDYNMMIKIEWEEKEVLEEPEFVFKGVSIEEIDKKLQENEEKEALEKEEVVEEYRLPVQLQLNSISQDGEVDVKFNQALKVPDLSNLILTYSSMESKDESKRELQEVDGKTNIKDIIDLSVDQFQYAVTLQDWTSKGMVFKIEFDDPLAISKNGQKNALSFQVKENSYFVSKQHGLSIDEENKAIKSVKSIPIQLPKGISAKELEETAKSQENSVKAILIVQLAIMLVLKGQKDKLWAMLLALQVIVYLPIYNVDHPGNVQIFLKAIRKIAEFKVVGQDEFFDFFNIDNPFKKSFTSKEEQLEQEAYAAAGFESFDMLENMAYYLIILCIGVFVIIIVAFLSMIKKLRQRIVAKLVQVKDAFMYNGIIRSFNLTYLKQFVNFGLATSVLRYSNEETKINISSTTTLFIGISLILYPAWSTWFLFKNRNNLDQKEIKAKYQSLYLGLRTNSLYYLVYPLIFLLRRILFVVFALANQDLPYLQVQCLVFTVSIYMIYIGQHKPHDRRKSQRLELFNEFMILVICYHMFCFTQWVENSIQYDIGTSKITAVIFLMLTNLVVMFSDIKRPLILKYRLQQRIKKMKKLKEERRKNKYHQYKKAKIGMENQINNLYKRFEKKEQEQQTEVLETPPKMRPKPKKKKMKKKKKKEEEHQSLEMEVAEIQALELDENQLRKRIAENIKQAKLIQEQEEAEKDRKLQELIRGKKGSKYKIGNKFVQTKKSQKIAQKSRAKAKDMNTIVEEEESIIEE